MIRNFARFLQILSALAAAAFVVLLFANEPKLLAAPKPTAAANPAATAASTGASTAASAATPTSGAAANGGPPSSAAGASTAPPATQPPTTTGPPIDAPAIFGNRCSSCHGASAQGGVGPQLAGGRVAAKFPDIEQQVALVRDGKGGMPSFARKLTEDEIRAVVRYTRTL